MHLHNHDTGNEAWVTVRIGEKSIIKWKSYGAWLRNSVRSCHPTPTSRKKKKKKVWIQTASPGPGSVGREKAQSCTLEMVNIANLFRNSRTNFQANSPIPKVSQSSKTNTHFSKCSCTKITSMCSLILVF